MNESSGIYLALQYKYGGRVTTELIDTESDMTADEQLVTQYRMSTYIEQFIDPDDSSSEVLSDKPVFLSRCLSLTLCTWSAIHYGVVYSWWLCYVYVFIMQCGLNRYELMDSSLFLPDFIINATVY